MQTRMILTGNFYVIGAFLNYLKEEVMIKNGHEEKDDQDQDLLDVGKGTKVILVDFNHLHWVAIDPGPYTTGDETAVFHLGSEFDKAFAACGTIISHLAEMQKSTAP